MKNLKLYFLFFGLLDLCTLLAQFMYYPNVVGFFSFFTILANICAVCAFFYVGLNNKKLSAQAESFFGVTVVYMIVTALGYWTLLRDTVYPAMLPFANTVFHTIMPVAVFIGWLLYKHEHKLNYQKALSWLLFPSIYLLYTLTHSFITNWYPYPFFNPHLLNGYAGVFVYIIFLSFGFYMSGLFVIWIGNHHTNL